jgi:thiol-disulfide isomerase/thioredoxin
VLLSILRVAVFCVLADAAATSRAADLKLWTGGPPPALELNDLQGRAHRLADYRGRVVLVNFWATWCAPCREEMPSIQRLKQRFANRPFVVLAVNVDEPEARIHKFLSELPLDFPVLLDPEGRTTKAWKVRVLPASFVIARDGRIRYTVTGDLDWNGNEIAARLSELFQVTKSP